MDFHINLLKGTPTCMVLVPFGSNGSPWISFSAGSPSHPFNLCAMWPFQCHFNILVNLVRLGISLYLIWSRRARCTIKMLKNNITWFVFVIYSIVSSLFLSGRLHPFVPTKQNFSTPNIRKCLQSGRLNARLCYSDILCLYSPSLVTLWNILKSLYLSGIIRVRRVHVNKVLRYWWKIVAAVFWLHARAFGY